MLKGAFVVTGRAFTHPDVRGPVVKYLPATSPARTVYITEAFAEKHAEIAAILRETCPAWTFEVDLEAPAPPPAPPVHRCHQHVNCRAWHLPRRCPQVCNRPVWQAFLAKYNDVRKRSKRSQMVILKRH
jgi:hypothetical protein